MPKVCFYFLLHQPYRLTDYSVLDLDSGHDYFASSQRDQNKEVFLKVADKSYRPMLSLLLSLVEKEPKFKFSFSCSGVFLEQAQAWAPDVVELLQELAAHRQQVEILGENYYHSLSALYSEREFASQVHLQEKLLKKLFDVKPQIFRNTEMIYNNYIAWQVAKLGYRGMLTEGVDNILQGRAKTTIYRSNCQPALPLLLKHATLSDDIAFRFSQKSWAGWPLTAEKYLSWLQNYYPDESIGLFMDFETFGEHQWADTGIFDFFERFIQLGAKTKTIKFVTPSEQLIPKKMSKKTWQTWVDQLPVYDVEREISWADENRDLSAWRSNDLQTDTLKEIYKLEPKIRSSHDERLLTDWRRLQTSDHFYYMCTKYFADGDVHAYFSAYDSPFEAYRRYCIVLADLGERCR
ncbi:glycoside hydrolase family 57 protein [bacterium]|nr:glycoside hydrolase family 57 protein [bacterium]MBQ6436546.1 glycoside hydrolase family 57 protein [bacterium]